MKFLRTLQSRLVAIFMFILIFCSQATIADEGMWLISLIKQNIEQMQQMGLKLSASEIYSINNSSLKDAVVQLDDGGCSAEIISPYGLVLTNHHCAVSDIQYHSSVTNNLLRDGFWAQDNSQELPVPGKTALILQRVEDVTQRILSEVDVNAPDYFTRTNELANNVAKSIEKQEAGTHAVVVPMYSHNQFYLFVYHRFTDVRLVGAPPSSIGNFGGDVDNWRWPRHTGDFALFRIYTAPNGKPADFSKRNVPYKPKHHFPISLKGVGAGDFTMVIGYPGTTYRYSTSYHARNARDQVAPWVDEVWRSFISSIKKEMQTDADAKIALTDKHDMLVNFWQKDTYQAQSMYRFGVVPRLQQQEQNLLLWAEQQSAETSYAKALSQIQTFYQTLANNSYEPITRSLSSLVNWPVEVGSNIYALYDLIMELVQEKPSKRRVRREAKKLRAKVPEIFDNFNADVDIQLYSAALQSLLEHLPENLNDPLINEIRSKESYQTLIPFLVDYFYQQSYFSSPQNLMRFLENPSVDSLYSDPLFMLHLSYESQIQNLYGVLDSLSTNLQYAKRVYTKGVMEMRSNEVLYPDANSTMRLSYGKVVGYSPRDGIRFKPFTYLAGKMAKESPTQSVFNVDLREKQLWQERDFIPYADSLGVPVCFLTDNDITNGNSGSPVLNAQGHLVGIAFDGNQEAMACDFMFEPAMQRTIVTDIRYVLFIIDKFAGAQRLVDEMTVLE